MARPGIDSEASGCGVHACDVLYVVDVLGGELVPVVPVVVVQVLPDQGVGLNRAVRIHFRHVEVVQEVHQLLVARRTVVFASFLLQRFFKDFLENQVWSLTHDFSFMIFHNRHCRWCSKNSEKKKNDS